MGSILKLKKVELMKEKHHKDLTYSGALQHLINSTFKMIDLRNNKIAFLF